MKIFKKLICLACFLLFLSLPAFNTKAAQAIVPGQTIQIPNPVAETFYEFTFTPTVSGRYWIHSPNNIYFGIFPADRYHQVIEMNGERGLSSYLTAGYTYSFDFFVSPTDLSAEDWKMLTITFDMQYASDVEEPNSGTDQLRNEGQETEEEEEKPDGFEVENWIHEFFVGDQFIIRIDALPKEINAEVTCTSSDPSILSVTGTNEFTLTAHKPGTVTLTYSAGDIGESQDITVYPRKLNEQAPYGDCVLGEDFEAEYTVDKEGIYYFWTYGNETPWNVSCDTDTDYLIQDTYLDAYVMELHLKPGHVYKFTPNANELHAVSIELKDEHVHMKVTHVPEVPPQEKEDGMMEHYICESCNTYFLGEGYDEVPFEYLILPAYGLDWDEEETPEDTANPDMENQAPNPFEDPIMIIPPQDVPFTTLRTEDLLQGMEENRSVEIQFDGGNVILSVEMQNWLAELMGEGEVELSFENVDIMEMTDAQQEVLSAMHVQNVISASLFFNGEYVHEFNGTEMVLKVPYTKESGKTYQVLYIAKDGSMEGMGCLWYDDYVEIYTPHFSEFAIVAEDESNMPWALIAVVAIVICGGVAAFLIIRKKQGRKVAQ